MTSSVSSTVGWSFEIGLAPPPNHYCQYKVLLKQTQRI